MCAALALSLSLDLALDFSFPCSSPFSSSSTNQLQILFMRNSKWISASVGGILRSHSLCTLTSSFLHVLLQNSMYVSTLVAFFPPRQVTHWTIGGSILSFLEVQ